MLSSSAQTPRLLRSPTATSASSQILTTRKSLLSGQISAVDIAKSFLHRLRRTEPQLNSFLYVSPDDVVLKQADEEVGPLAGVLVGIKDNICTHDMPSTAGSRILENYRPPFAGEEDEGKWGYYCWED